MVPEPEEGRLDETISSKVLAPGTIISHYRIIDKIGQGGMGIVYKAEDTRLKRTVAIKFLPPGLTQDEEANLRFMNEAQAASALEHHNICNIHEIDRTRDGSLFVVMACYEGNTLEERIKRGALPVDEAVKIAVQIAEGLAKAHSKGIIHRDIKPSNVFITTDGIVKIIDFGLAKLAARPTMTREGTVLGTVAYMSPEQARGEEVDHRSDIWSLGVILYEMLAGERPFKGDREQTVIHSILNNKRRPLGKASPAVPPEIQSIVKKAMEMSRDSRYASAADVARDLSQYRDSLRAADAGKAARGGWLQSIRRPVIAIPAIGVLVGIILLGVWFYHRQARIRWAKEVALPEIERLLGNAIVGAVEAFELAVEAEKYIPDNPKLVEFFAKGSQVISVKTDPPGAGVYWKPYQAVDSEWRYLGITPVEDLRVPMTVFRWKLEKEGYRTVYAASRTFDWDVSRKDLFSGNDLYRVLDREDSIPEGMVRVSGMESDEGEFPDFYIDRYEVTNRQFKAFVEAGGYGDPRYWKHQFTKDGRLLSWEEAMAEFVDETGRSGPATWQVGDYKEGQDDYPVTGVSWYETAAFAEFAGKSLPTGDHWGMARRTRATDIGFFALMAPLSNFNGLGPEPAGKNQGISPFGVYDMAGNAREWCWNKTSQGRLVRGGAWNDNYYMAGNWSQAPAFNRSPRNGFRCARYLYLDEIPEAAFEPLTLREQVDLYEHDPVSEEVFRAYRRQFSYDRTALNVRVEWRNDTSEDWIQEKITFDAPYGDERVMACLFLPRNRPSPHQAVIYFPGSTSSYQTSSENLEEYREFEWYLEPIVKDGRAVLYPIYKGTFERRDDFLTSIHGGDDSYAFTEYAIQLVKDFRRCVDYLETRDDIDSNKLALLGVSWGGEMAPIILAVEDRIKAAVLSLGGTHARGLPEVNPANYIPRVEVPTLMLNGRYDMTFRYETQVKPMFDLLGTQEEDKRLILYDTDHFIPRTDATKQILAWLDRYLGPLP